MGISEHSVNPATTSYFLRLDYVLNQYTGIYIVSRPNREKVFVMHKTVIKVRGYHLDLYQHVNNARYLEFLEEARWNYLEDSGDLAYFAQHKLAWIIANININYRDAAKMGDTLEISTCFSKIGSKSAVVKQVITYQGSEKVVADADITIVCLDIRTGKPLPIEGELRQRLEQQ